MRIGPFIYTSDRRKSTAGDRIAGLSLPEDSEFMKEDGGEGPNQNWPLTVASVFGARHAFRLMTCYQTWG